MNQITKKWLLVGVGVSALAAIGATQVSFGQLIKLVGVGAAVKQFGPQINSGINNLSGHKDTSTRATKVVPILTVGINASNAIGAAQVMGVKSQVDKVEAVAQLEGRILGNEVRIKALIPVSSKDVIKDIKKVDGVGVSGIVDLKL